MSPSSPLGSSSSLSSYNPNATLLALPDGPIPPNHPDLRSHCVSMIGGYPTFPPLSSSLPSEINCGVCHQHIPLLAQVYCPLEGGENDRTLYVWGCWRAGCQRREGSLLFGYLHALPSDPIQLRCPISMCNSVRAFRASVRNDEYVKDVAEKRALAEKAAAQERELAKINPFTMGTPNIPGSTLFGGDGPLFGGSSQSTTNPFSAPSGFSNPFSTVPSSSPSTPPASIEVQPPDISSLSIAGLTKVTSLQPPLPAFQPAQYLTTIDEYVPPVDTDSDDDDDEDQDDTNESPEEKSQWVDEKWEKILPQGVDEIFERFVKRLENADGGVKQVLRYDFDAVPLPYSAQSSLFKRLFPTYTFSATSKPSSDPDDDEDPLNEFYDTSSIPKCPRCSSERVFELQLVPSLISLLKPETISTTGQPVGKGKKGQTEEERKKELARLAAVLAGEVVAEKEGSEEQDMEGGEMEWGTVMVFACKGDCVGMGEEWVGVEWESTT